MLNHTIPFFSEKMFIGLRSLAYKIWGPIFLGAIVTCLYVQVLHFGFTNWDDQAFILENPFLQKVSLSNVIQIFTPGSLKNELLYIPITYMSFMAERAVFGLKANFFHGTNVLLHLCNTLLVYQLIKSWTNSEFAGFIGGVIFGIHPLQVETVAWIMGRKDLLSTTFAIGSMFAYTKFRKTGNTIHCFSIIMSFICAILAKPTLIILPVLFPLIVIFRKESIRRSDLLLFLSMLLISGLAYLGSHPSSPAQSSWITGKSFFQMVFIPPLISDTISRVLLLKPVVAFYSSSQFYTAANLSLFAFIQTALLIAVFIAAIRKNKHWLWSGILAVILSFTPSLCLLLLNNRLFITADRYAYFPLLFVCFLIGQTLAFQTMKRKVVMGSLVVVFGIASGFKTYQQIPIWKNSETLWKSILEFDPHNPVAYNMLGNANTKNGKENEALRNYRKGAAIQPSYVRAYYNLARLYSENQQLDVAIKYYRRSLVSKADFLDARYNMALVYSRKGDLSRALNILAEVLDQNPQYVNALYSQGLFYKRLGQFENALSSFDQLVKIHPEYTKAYLQRGIIYHKMGETHRAIVNYDSTLKSDSKNFKAHYNLALIYDEDGFVEKALHHYSEAVKLDPNDPDPWYKLGKTYMRIKEYEKAVQYFYAVLNLKPNFGAVTKDLGIALYQLKRFEEAKSPILQAIKLGFEIDSSILRVLKIGEK